MAVESVNASAMTGDFVYGLDGVVCIIIAIIHVQHRHSRTHISTQKKHNKHFMSSTSVMKLLRDWSPSKCMCANVRCYMCERNINSVITPSVRPNGTYIVYTRIVFLQQTVLLSDLTSLYINGLVTKCHRKGMVRGK